MECTKCKKDTGAKWKTLCSDCWKSQSTEEIRAYRQAKLDRKIARLRKQASNMENVSNNLTSQFRELSQDIAWVTQPNINSSRGRAFRNSREKVLNKYDKGMRLSIEAEKIKEKANWMEGMGVRVKGDAQKKREAERMEQDKIIHIGTKIITFLNQSVGTVVKVNKNTYTVQFEQGRKYAVEKNFCNPIA